MLSELNRVGHWFRDEPADAWQFDEIAFDEATKAAIISLGMTPYKFTVFDHSAKIDNLSNSNHCYIPGCYVLYAVKLQPFMALLNTYMDIFETLIKVYDATRIDRIISSKDDSPDVLASLDTYSRDNFFKVFEHADHRLGAKNIINDDKQKGKRLRGVDDFVISIILKTLPVPDSNSSLLGRMIYTISKNPAVLQHLSSQFGGVIPYMFCADNGDELLFRVLVAIGCNGQLEPLMGHDPKAENMAWHDVDQAFHFHRMPVADNERYFHLPVHYSTRLKQYVFICKGLLDSPESLEKISGLVADLWSGMAIKHRDGRFYFESAGRVAVSGPVVTGGVNRIFYGAPGTGKSYRVHREMSKDAEKIITVFHPDTQHNDFVGALKPAMEADGRGGHSVTYSFRPGPFTCALLKAFSQPHRKVCLIIEEINRASAAAVFGELFQLLDRDPDGKSTYNIDATDPDMLSYLNTELKAIGCAPLARLSIPANLSLLATMNSSDQAVMPLDTAFKRRWSFEYLPIDFSQSAIPQTKIVLFSQSDKYELLWPVFAQVINSVLIECDIAEDRLIGPFFLDATELATPEKAKDALAGKLFIYLWDDVLRHTDHKKIFSSDCKTFGDLSAAFREDRPVFSPWVEEKLRGRGIVLTGEGNPQDAEG